MEEEEEEKEEEVGAFGAIIHSAFTRRCSPYPFSIATFARRVRRQYEST